MPTTAGRRAAELAFLSIFVAIIAAVLYETRVTLVAKRAASGDAFSNSALFPEIIAGLMALCVVAIFVQALMASDRTVKEAAPDTLPDAWRSRLAFFLVILIGYIAVFRVAGYYLSTTLAVAALLALLQTRSVLAYIVFPAGVALVIGFVFEILFNVVLPLGFPGLTLQRIFG